VGLPSGAGSRGRFIRQPTGKQRVAEGREGRGGEEGGGGKGAGGGQARWLNFQSAC